MSGHFWLTDAQVERLGPFFPKSRRLIRGLGSTKSSNKGMFLQ